jgi:hypothetical protein
MKHPSPENRADLVVNEAIRLIVRQEATVDAFHSRAVSLLAVESLVAALFGAQLISKVSGWHLALQIVALVLFLLTVALVICIEWPRDWFFTYKLDQWVGLMERGEPVKLVDFASAVTNDLSLARKSNEVKINRMATQFTWLCVVAGAQVLAWAIAAI